MFPMLSMRRVPIIGMILIATLSAARASSVPSVAAQTAPPPSFAADIAKLSEPGGYFDTDNLISNERSYLHVVPDLLTANVRGGAYIGVGPDQNFSYIAHVRPAVAFIVDIRRDNLLLHLLFKSVFSMARTRVEYLGLLFGRRLPEPLDGWEARPLDAIVAYMDKAAPLGSAEIAALRARTSERIASFGVPLSAPDLATIDRFHRQFIDAGLWLQFTSTGRAPQSFYPTYRDLLIETDRNGRQRSFLATEGDFQFLKALQGRHAVIPVVGDLSGSTALVAVGRAIAARRETLSAFYASNVEFYLFRAGTFARFMANLKTIPHAPNAVVIRSVFTGGGSWQLTHNVPDLLDGFARGRFRSYSELTAPQGRLFAPLSVRPAAPRSSRP